MKMRTYNSCHFRSRKSHSGRCNFANIAGERLCFAKKPSQRGERVEDSGVSGRVRASHRCNSLLRRTAPEAPLRCGECRCLGS